MAKKALGKVALGEDPQADRVDRRGKDLLTLRSQADEYLAAKEHELAPRTFIEMRRYLTDPRYFGPLHGMAVDKIKRKDIASRVVVIMRERGNPTAARARGALGSFFTWAMRMGLVESNPTIGSVAPVEDGGRDRVLSDSELAARLACLRRRRLRPHRPAACLRRLAEGRDRRHVLDRAG